MSTSKPAAADSAVAAGDAKPAEAAPANQPAILDEDDEFEDFPVDDWTQEDSEVPGDNTHLWEESWDDDDENEDFSKQLKEELKKVEAAAK